MDCQKPALAGGAHTAALHESKPHADGGTLPKIKILEEYGLPLAEEFCFDHGMLFLCARAKKLQQCKNSSIFYGEIGYMVVDFSHRILVDAVYDASVGIDAVYEPYNSRKQKFEQKEHPRYSCVFPGSECLYPD